MAEGGEPLPLDSPHWMPVVEAHRLLTGLLADPRLAAKDLTAAVTDERLPCMRRVTVIQGTPDSEIVPQRFWQRYAFGFVHPAGFPDDDALYTVERDFSYIPVPLPFAFFVWRPALAQLWPAAFAPSTPAPPEIADTAAPSAGRKRGSREQDLVKAVAVDLWPDGYKHVEPKDLIKRVGDELERRRLPVPKRDVILRALGRRKG